MKTIKQLLEVYKPKAKDEQEFVDKHIVIKHKDRNGNGDEVFNASKVKYNKRAAERHGYDSGEDEKVYEEVDDLDEMKNLSTEKLHALVARGDSDPDGMSPAFGMQIKAARNELQRRKKTGMKEDVEDFEESYDELMRLKNNIVRNRKKMNSIQGIHPEKKRLAAKIESDTKKHKDLFNKQMGKNESVEEIDLAFFEDLLEMNLDEDTFTDASLANLRVMKHKQMMKDLEKSKKHPLMKVRLMSDAKKKLADLEKARDHYVAKHEKATSKKKKVVEDVDEVVEEAPKGYGGRSVTGSRAGYWKRMRQIEKIYGDKSMALAHEKIRARHAKVPANEEVEQIDELSKNTLANYAYRATNQVGEKGLTAGLKIQNNEPAGKELKTMGRRQRGVAMALKRLTKEDVEAIDELSKKTLGSYAKKAGGVGLDSAAANALEYGSVSRDPNTSIKARMKPMRKAMNRARGVERAVDRLTKEDIINRAIENYMPEDYTPPSLEDQFLARIEHLPEAHAVTLFTLFDSLNEDNQNVMIESANTEEGVNSLLDFAIKNRGE